jgi:hypothetical protein
MILTTAPQILPEGPPIRQGEWESNPSPLSLGPMFQAAGAFIEDAATALSELVRADITEGALKTMVVVLGQTWLRGKPSVTLPSPADTNFAALACVEWRNIRYHVEFAVQNRMLNRKVDERGQIEYEPIHPQHWLCTWRKKRKEFVALVASLSEQVSGQLLLQYGPFETVQEMESRRCVHRKSESRDKTGAERPAIAVCAEIQIEDQRGEDSRAEIQTIGSRGPSDFRANAISPSPPITEIQKIAPPLNSERFSSGTKLCTTAEAIKALKANALGELRKAAIAQLQAIKVDEKRSFCGSMKLSAEIKLLQQELKRALPEAEWNNWGGRWTNALKLDDSSVRRIVDEWYSMRREGRAKEVDSPGSYLWDLLRRWSLIIRIWYPIEEAARGAFSEPKSPDESGPLPGTSEFEQWKQDTFR